MKIIFEPHAETPDNVADICSGWDEVAPTSAGEEEARALGQRYRLSEIDAIFAPDLPRAYRTVEIAFPDLNRGKFFLDWRLREADYGRFTHRARSFIRQELPNRIHTPFPEGESYSDVMRRMKSFTTDLTARHLNTVLVVGSRGTRCGLDHWLNNRPIEECIQGDGRLVIVTD